MKIQRLISVILMFSAGSAMAIPVANLNSIRKSNEQANCQRRDSTGDFRDLIHKVAVIDQDDRDVLSRTKRLLGISDAEEQNALACMGTIVCMERVALKDRQPCPDDAELMQGQCVRIQYQSAGAFCAPGGRRKNGSCRADRLGTAGHLFVEKDTNRFMPQLENCRFFNYKGHQSELKIGDLNSLDPTQAGLNPYQNMRADGLPIRLKTPIAGCDPLDLNPPSETPARGHSLIAMTAVQADMDKNRFRGDQPIAYPCQVMNNIPAEGNGPGLLFTNCDVNKGGSGGFVLVRSERDNKLKVAGIFIRAGKMSMNGKPYNESTSPRNVTTAVVPEAGFLVMAQTPGTRISPQLSVNNSPDLQPTSD